MPLPHEFDGHREVRGGVVETGAVKSFQQLHRLAVEGA
jgi:hypothetical protein